MREILFHVLNTMVTKKTQVVSSNLIALAREISDLIPRTARALRNFPIFLNLDFPQLLDSQRNMLKFLINVEKDLTKLLNGLLNLCRSYLILTLLLGSHHIHFSFRRYWFLVLDAIIAFETD